MVLDSFIFKILNKSTARDATLGLKVLKGMLIKVKCCVIRRITALLLCDEQIEEPPCANAYDQQYYIVARAAAFLAQEFL